MYSCYTCHLISCYLLRVYYSSLFYIHCDDSHCYILHYYIAGGITGEEASEETVKEGDEGCGVEEEFDNDELREWRAAGVIVEGGIMERGSADRELSQLGATREEEEGGVKD
jgi:hypothetical protein